MVVLHTDWDYWSEIDYERYRSQIEWSLADFKALITAAHQQRVTDWGGRVGPDAHVPVAHTDANTLHDFYVNIGAYDHPDGPPELPPPLRGDSMARTIIIVVIAIAVIALAGVGPIWRGSRK